MVKNFKKGVDILRKAELEQLTTIIDSLAEIRLWGLTNNKAKYFLNTYGKHLECHLRNYRNILKM